MHFFIVTAVRTSNLPKIINTLSFSPQEKYNDGGLPLVGEVSANVCGWSNVALSVQLVPTAVYIVFF
jgi:hypothetical protein